MFDTTASFTHYFFPLIIVIGILIGVIWVRFLIMYLRVHFSKIFILPSRPNTPEEINQLEKEEPGFKSSGKFLIVFFLSGVVSFFGIGFSVELVGSITSNWVILFKILSFLFAYAFIASVVFLYMTASSFVRRLLLLQDLRDRKVARVVGTIKKFVVLSEGFPLKYIKIGKFSFGMNEKRQKEIYNAIKANRRYQIEFSPHSRIIWNYKEVDAQDENHSP